MTPLQGLPRTQAARYLRALQTFGVECKLEEVSPGKFGVMTYSESGDVVVFSSQNGLAVLDEVIQTAINNHIER
jgi:hypothetical protein